MKNLLCEPSIVALTVESILSWVPMVGILSHAFNRFYNIFTIYNQNSWAFSTFVKKCGVKL